MRHALIVSGVVENVVVALPPEGDWTDLSDFAERAFVGPNWSFDGEKFSPPVQPPAPPLPTYKSYTYSGFIDALTRTEAVAILVGAKTDPLLEMFIEIARARSSVDFNDEATRDSAPYLVQAGVLTTERLAELIG